MTDTTNRPLATHRAIGHRFAITGDRRGRDLLEAVLSPLAEPSTVPAERTYGLEFHTDEAAASIDEIVTQRGEPGTTVALLMTAMNVAAIGSTSDFVVHAATLSRNGAAVVFPGAPGAGKSTLALALASAGFDYLSDETAVIDASLDVISYPKPIVVGDESIALVDGASDAAIASLGDRWFVAADRLTGRAAPASSQLRMVVAPHHRRNGPVRCRTMSPGETAALCASNSFNLRRLGRPGLELAAVVGRTVPGRELHHDGVATAVPMIIEQIDAHLDAHLDHAWPDDQSTT